mgnify:FL=1
MKLPTVKEIRKLHLKYALNKKVFLLIFTHCQIIKDISKQLIRKNGLTIDRKLVMTGSLLHDIGAYRFIDQQGIFDEINYIRHGIEGYQILSREGFPKELCLIAERHTGVGISKDDVVKQGLNLPARNYLPVTVEEKIIMYADKFHSKSSRFNSFSAYALYVKRFGQDKVKRFQSLAQVFGIPNLKPLAEKYSQTIV